MAIKPDDCIVPYGKLVRWDLAPNSLYHWEIQYDVSYLKNFDEHVYEFATFNNLDLDTVRSEELAKFHATFKACRTNDAGNYIKFESAADLTYFILRWS